MTRQGLLLVSLLLFTIEPDFGQITGRSASYAFSSDTTVQLTVGGELDASNTVGRMVNYQFDLYRYYTLGFQPLKSVTLTNDGVNTVHNVALVFNNTGQWQTLTSMTQHIFNPTDNDKKRALKLWQFVESNHQYFYSPEPFPAQEIQDPVKFLTSYGYGDCFMIANTVKYLNTTYTKDSLWFWTLNSGQHAVAEVKVNNAYALLDADEGGFYLHLDNRTLASYDDIRYDPYLYLRTQHFGPAYPYNSPLNYSNVLNYQSSGNYRSMFSEFGNSGINAGISLMPGESFSFVWPDTSVLAPFHQLIVSGYGQDPTLNDVGTAIKEGVFIFKPNFLTANTNQILYQVNNLVFDPNFGDTVPVVHPLSMSGGPSMMMHMVSPFVLTGANIQGSFYVRTPSDAVTLQYSPDLVNWTTIWQSQDTGHFATTIPLDGMIAPLQNTATYGYYLRFNFHPASSVTGCGVDSVTMTDSCQVSRFFAPALLVGNNSIAVQTGDSVKQGRQLQLSVQWQENSSNTPPDPVAAPLFPPAGASVSGTSFAFSWQPAVDPDGDSIVDYFFELSDDSSMTYPLATNFYRYMSAIRQPVVPEFTPERPDFLNDGTTYYWRIRALDSRGAWSTWSPTWSFTPHGPRTPVDFHYQWIDSTHVTLQWSPNPQGNTPVTYQIYSDSVRGSFPTPALVVATTSDTSLNLGYNRMTYVRICAVDGAGNQSPPSPYITLWPAVTMQYGAIPLASLLPSVSNNNYPLRYSARDTSFFQVNGSNLTAKKTGLSYLYAGFVGETDSIFAQEEVPVVVTKAPLLIAATNMTKVYGDSVGPLRYQFVGFVNGDDSSALDTLPILSTTVTASSPVGNYPIIVEGGSDNAYALSYQNGVYTVDSAQLAITADNDTIDFGSPIPKLTYTITGWRNTDSSGAFQAPPQISTDAVQGSPAGTYAITIGDAIAFNYAINYSGGSLLINPTPPKLSFVVHGDYPDSNYNYKLTIDSSGGTFDNVVILLRDLGWNGSYPQTNSIALSEEAQLLNPADLPDGKVYTGVLDNIIYGHNYMAYAVISNAAGSDTSQSYNIFTNVNAPFSISPNPAVSTVELSMGIASEGGVQVVIYNDQGQVMYRNTDVQGADVLIDVSQMASGPYFVSVLKGKHQYTQEILIFH